MANTTCDIDGTSTERFAAVLDEQLNMVRERIFAEFCGQVGSLTSRDKLGSSERGRDRMASSELDDSGELLDDKESVLSVFTPIQQWRNLVVRMMRPKARINLVEHIHIFREHACWLEYLTMLRSNHNNCREDYARAKQLIIKARRGILSMPTSRRHSVLGRLSASLGMVTGRSFVLPLLHPHSLWKRIWVWFSIAVVFFDAIAIPLCAAFDFNDSLGLNVIMWFSLVFWILDIVISFRSGLDLHGSFEMRPSHIARNYARSWMVFDMMAVVVDWSLFILDIAVGNYGMGSFCDAEPSIRTVRLLRLIRLAKLDMMLEYALAVNIKQVIMFSRVIKVSIAYLLYFHVLACLWYGIGKMESGWADECKTFTTSRCYFYSANWAFGQISGISNVAYDTELELAFSTCSLVIALMLFAVFMGIIIDAFGQKWGRDRNDVRIMCAAYSRNHHLSSNLSRRLLQYVDDVHMDLAKRLRQEEEMFQYLPLPLQSELLQEVRKPLLTSASFVKDLDQVHATMSTKLATDATATVVAIPGESMFTVGEFANCWQLVESGTLAYMTTDGIGDEEYTGTAGKFGTGTHTMFMEESAYEPTGSFIGTESSVSSVMPIDPAPKQAAAKRPSGVGAISPGSSNTRENAASSKQQQHQQKRLSLVVKELIPSLMLTTAVRHNDNLRGLLNRTGEKVIETVVRGASISEMVLWTPWRRTGDMIAASECMLLNVIPEAFYDVIKCRLDTCLVVAMYASKYVKKLNESEYSISDLYQFFNLMKEIDEDEPDASDAHFKVFLSHYKLESGTEATLMAEALQNKFVEAGELPSECGVFLDSENLTDLSELRAHVERSENFVLFLTPGVLSRPWCLVEIVTAMKNGAQIVPVEIQRRGLNFAYPDDGFYAKLRKGETLTRVDLKCLSDEGVTLTDVEEALRFTFKQIALPFSPHKSKNVRMAELNDVVLRCLRKPKRTMYFESASNLSLNPGGSKESLKDVGMRVAR